MPESLAPGIYVEELPGLFHPIPGISASTEGFIGLADNRNLPLVPGNIPMQGNVIWGARTSAEDTQWQYVDVRRFTFFLEQSLRLGLQGAVFENNGPSLWQSVSQSIENFLTNQWIAGKLHGKKKQEAFFVKCDSTTMTQNDLDNGRLVMIVGFAPVRPAEFVVLQTAVHTKKK